MLKASPADNRHITRAATDLIAQHGYQHLTMTRLADTLEMPLATLQADYTCKEEVTLLLYQQLSDDLLAYVQTLPPDTLATMYHTLMTYRLQQMSDHAQAMGALFSAAMRPDCAIESADISPGKADSLYQSVEHLIQQATDTPGDPDDMTYLLYSFHFLTIVFWLYDRTDDKQGTHMLLGFFRDLLKRLRPLLVMPFARTMLTKLARILMLVFGGATLKHD